MKLKNVETPFTELFSLLTRYKVSPQDFLLPTYTHDQLKIMQQHIENAIATLLQGLQGLGQLTGIAAQLNQSADNDGSIGFLISAIGNLTEALNTLRADTLYILGQNRE